MNVYIALELKKDKDGKSSIPNIIGVYSTEKSAQKAYEKSESWVNIIKMPIEK